MAAADRQFRLRTSGRLAAVGLLLAWGLPAAALAGPLELRPCRQVLLLLEDPAQQAAARELAEMACVEVQDLGPRFGFDDEQFARILVPADMRSWQAHTGQSLFTAAVYTSRGAAGLIVVRPLGERPAASLRSTLRHEMVHMLISRRVGSRCPRWLDEGLAQWFEGRRAPPLGPAEAPTDETALTALELHWRNSEVSAEERRGDYYSSLRLVALLMKRPGEAAVLAALRQLRHRRDALTLDMAGRSLGMWLFSVERPRGPAPDASAVDRSAVSTPDAPREGPVTPLPLEDMMRRAKRSQKAAVDGGGGEEP